MALQAYLERICIPTPGAGATAPRHATPTLLRDVHRHHALNIPFENLSLVHHRLSNLGAVRTDQEAVHEKLVKKRRGGWCYEMNTLLHSMLSLLGFNCYLSLARVVQKGSQQPPTGPFQGLPSSNNKGRTLSLTPSSHLVIFTSVGNEIYLCDVGFGGQGLLEPVLLKAHDDAKAPGDSVQAGTRFRLRRGVLGSAEQLSAAQAMDHPEALSHVGWYLQAHLGGSWSDLYYFRQDATTAADIEMVSYYTKREHAMFTKSHVVTKPTDDGRLTLYDYTLKTKKQGETIVKELKTQSERDEVLQEVFNIDLAAV